MPRHSYFYSYSYSYHSLAALMLLLCLGIAQHPHYHQVAAHGGSLLESISHFLQPNLQECRGPSDGGGGRRGFFGWGNNNGGGDTAGNTAAGKGGEPSTCPPETECVQRRCLPTDTERRTMIQRSSGWVGGGGGDMQRALFAASLSATQFQAEPPGEVNRTNAHTCARYQLYASQNFQPEGYRYSLYVNPAPGAKFDVLVFKGTTSRREWVDDFNFFQAPCTMTTDTITPGTATNTDSMAGGSPPAGGAFDSLFGQGNNASATTPSPASPASPATTTPSCGLVHSGFQTVFERMRPDLDRLLAQRFREHPRRRLVVTGHSLGAALATLASVHISAQPGWQDKLRAVLVMGSPRVGDPTFVDAFRRLVSSRVLVRRYFMVDGSDAGAAVSSSTPSSSTSTTTTMMGMVDPVTLLPSATLGYKHVVPGVGIECRDVAGQSDVCSARQLHSIDLYVEVLTEMVQQHKFFAFRKCGQI